VRKAVRLEWIAKAKAEWEAKDADQLAAWTEAKAAHKLLPRQKGRNVPKKPAPPPKPQVPAELLDTDDEPMTLTIRRGGKKSRAAVVEGSDDEVIAFEGGGDEDEEEEDEIDD